MDEEQAKTIRGPGVKIVVLGGGNSTERDVSLRSAAAVSGALQQAGYEVTMLDPYDGFHVLDTIRANTVTFPILHGKNGEDGVIQAELEKRNLPYLGTSSKASAKCFNKWSTRQILIAAGVPMAAGELVNKTTYYSSALIKMPHVLKVSEGGSSIGTYIVRDPVYIDRAKVDDVFELSNEAVIEELIEGVEITVPILDGKPLPVVEIRLPDNAEFDYENKYNGATKDICPPVSISETLQRKAQEIGLQVDAVMGCRHLSRTDIIVRHDGSMVVLEVNTMPGMTDRSLFPVAANAAGLPMPKLVKLFVDIVIRDYNLA